MSRPAFPGFALSAGMLWLLAGAMYKLFDGSPNDLPQIIKDQSPLDAWDTMRTAIAVELAVVGLVIALPRVGWLFLAATFGVFIAILAPMVAAGETSCGCFGGSIEIDPRVMIGIDGGLLLLVLISRPWRMKGAGLGAAAYVPLLAVAIAAPMLKLTKPELPPAVDRSELIVRAGSDNETSSSAGDPTTLIDGAAAAVDGVATEIEDVATDVGDAAQGALDEALNGAAGATDSATDSATDTANDPAPTPEETAYELPEFQELQWSTWDGVEFFETDIGRMAALDVNAAVPPDAHVVVYRRSCEVCRDHLEQLFTDTQNDPNHLGGKILVLLRIEESKDVSGTNLCEMPEQSLPAEKVTLPALKRGYGITTPMSFDVNGEYKVENVVDVRKIMGH